MSALTENKVKKLNMFYRVLSGFIFFCSMVATIGATIAVVSEPFRIGAILGTVVIVAVVAIMAYVSGRIMITGYAPKFLLFTHAPKNNT